MISVLSEVRRYLNRIENPKSRVSSMRRWDDCQVTESREAVEATDRCCPRCTSKCETARWSRPLIIVILDPVRAVYFKLPDKLGLALLEYSGM